jgi:4-amino-4-deoxy-L-arabinose transferase-like glycosyltransferase
MRARSVLVLVILCAVPFLDLGRRVLWPPDEGRYAEIVREMVASDDYVVPTWAGRPNIDKPPLFMWAGVAASRLMGGVSERSVRLPSVLSACVFLLSTCYLGVRLFDPMTGLLAALVLGTCGRFLLYSQWCATDMMLASFVTLALAVAVGGRGAPAGNGEGRASIPIAGLLFMGVCALAVLTKGPIGAVLPIGVVVTDAVVARRLRLRQIVEDLSRLAAPWGAGAPVFLAVAAPWFLLLHSRLGSAGLREILFHQNVSRFLDAWNAQQPWYFYLEMFPLDFLPWSFFLPIAFLPLSARDGDRARAWRFLRVWFLLIFVFFSTASGKSPEYLMPILPAASLMVARLFALAASAAPATEESGVAERRRLVVPASIAAAGALAGLAALALGRKDLLPGAGGEVLAAALLITAGVIGCLAALRTGRALSSAILLAAAVLLVRVFPAGAFMDAGNRLNIAPEVGRQLGSLLEPGSKVGVGRKGADYILYYADVPVVPLERPARIVAFLADGPPNAVVIKGREYKDLEDRLSGISQVAARFGDGERGYVLLKARSR